MIDLMSMCSIVHVASGYADGFVVLTLFLAGQGKCRIVAERMKEERRIVLNKN